MSEYLITQPEFLTDCMEDPQMFARLSVLLWDKLKDIEKMGGQIKEKVLEEINENIFAVLKAGILSISSKEWKTALKTAQQWCNGIIIHDINNNLPDTNTAIWQESLKFIKEMKNTVD